MSRSRGNQKGRFTFWHGHQSNAAHIVWLGLGFILGMVLYSPTKDLIVNMLLRN